jgi:hypothetical protein
MADNSLNLIIIDKTALHPLRTAGIRRQKEHVSLAQQLLRPNRIQNNP